MATDNVVRREEINDRGCIKQGINSVSSLFPKKTACRSSYSHLDLLLCLFRIHNPRVDQEIPHVDPLISLQLNHLTEILSFVGRSSGLDVSRGGFPTGSSVGVGIEGTFSGGFLGRDDGTVASEFLTNSG